MGNMDQKAFIEVSFSHAILWQFLFNFEFVDVGPSPVVDHGPLHPTSLAMQGPVHADGTELVAEIDRHGGRACLPESLVAALLLHAGFVFLANGIA